MAKIALLFLLVAALAVAGFARDVAFTRSLRQDPDPPAYTCSQAKGLQGQGCDDFIKCLTNHPEFADQATPANLKLFATSCKKCAEATTDCPEDDALPTPCKTGLSYGPVLTCAQELTATPK